MQITTLNELPVPTLDDMTAGATVVLCGEDHPFDCKRFECVKVVAEQGALIMVTYGWMHGSAADVRIGRRRQSWLTE